MTYSVPETWSLESLLEYFWSAQAVLEADPATAALSPPWLDLESKLATERTSRDAARKLLIKASALQRFKDVVWDQRIDAIGDRAMFDAGRDAKVAPYATLFGSVRPSDAKDLGAMKAGELGTVLVGKLRALGGDYTELADLFDAASKDLLAAAATRKETSASAQVHDVRRRALIDETEALISKTQIGILSAYPGDAARVRAALATRRDPTRVKDAEEPEKKPE